MTTFTHVSVGTNDIARSRQFYDIVLATLGWTRIVDLGDGSSMWGDGRPSFMVTQPRDGKPASVGNGVTISFEAPDHDAVHAFHEAALALGSPDRVHGPPEQSPPIRVIPMATSWRFTATGTKAWA